MNHIHLTAWIPVLTSSQEKYAPKSFCCFFCNLEREKLVLRLHATQTIHIGYTDLSSQLCVKINATLRKSALSTCQFKRRVLMDISNGIDRLIQLGRKWKKHQYRFWNAIRLVTPMTICYKGSTVYDGNCFKDSFRSIEFSASDRDALIHTVQID